MIQRTRHFTPHDVRRTDQPDGSVLLEAKAALGPVVRCTGDWLHRWANETPDQTFIAERSGAGWRRESYAATLQQVRAIAAALLGRGLGAQTPIMILSGNSVDHALLTLAAQYVGIPTVPLAEQYARVPAAHPRLIQAMTLIRPALVYADDAATFDPALALPVFDGVEVVSSQPGPRPTTAFSDLLKGGSADITAAHAAITPDTVAKILMTSGSTSAPKGVLTTHKMLCTNQTQLTQGLPFLTSKPPKIVDWLPWNHVFGGSHNFNMMLANGGSLYIDGGKPAPGLFDLTVENLKQVTGTLCFNVPVGFQMLLGALQADKTLRSRFFAELDMIFYAGASLPQDVWEGFEAMAVAVKGEVPLITSSWGLTETAPATLMQQEPTDTSGVVGVPLPGITIKLVPQDDNRFEARAKGPNIMPGYFDAPAKTAEAFDREGYFVTGDAMAFVDPNDPNKGLKFDGRLSEDFKLLTGTWVRAANLRLDMLGLLAPLVADLVVTGADRGEIGLMLFPNLSAIQNAGLDDQALKAEIKNRLKPHAQNASSSARIARAILLTDPPSMPEGEMTAKGNLNFRRVLTRRADVLERLYSNDPAVITL